MEKRLNNRFGKACKIRDKKEIKRLFNKEKLRISPSCTIAYLENGRNLSRCVIIVPKKTGTAATRNNIKRKIREKFRVCLKKTARPLDILIKVHPAEKEEKKTSGLEKALSIWFESVNMQSLE